MEIETQKEDFMTRFPTLYKKSSKGKIQEWAISVVENPDHSTAYDIYVTHGVQDGKMQTAVDTIFEGKNIGKANETSVHQQALHEAKSKWTKQQDRKGYKTDINKLDIDERPGAEPMLAHTYATIIEGVLAYTTNSKKIKFPCAAQPKLDGHRCLTTKIDSINGMYSRKRQAITGLPHINTEVQELNTSLSILDGELYNHDYKDNFEELSGFIASKEPKEGHEVVQYHIYDVVMPGTYKERLIALANIFSKYTGNTLIMVPTTIVNNKEEAEAAFHKFKEQGYEGAILRNLDSEYASSRTNDLQKFKEFMDAEFKIIGVKDGKGSMRGKAIFICEVKPGVTFDVKMKGSMELLAEIYENQDQYIGRELTVFFDKYLASGKPRFPIGLRLREDI